MRRWYMSRLMDTEKMLMLRRHFLAHFIILFFAKPFKLPINRIVKILTSNWIVQSLRRYVYVSFIAMWYNVPHFFQYHRLYWLLGMRSSSFRSSVLGEMIQIICHIFGSLRSINVTSGDKSRSSVLVPDGPDNSAFLQLPLFSSVCAVLVQVITCLSILERCRHFVFLLSQRRSLTVNV